jgi:hypothetical protein
MKKSLIPSILLLAVLFQYCTQSDLRPNRAQVEFTVNVTSENEERETSTLDLNEAKSLLLTLERANGDVVLQDQKVNLVVQDGLIRSEALDLQPGDYKIRDFFVLDENGEVLYASPKQSSMLAKKFNVLSGAFTLSADNKTNIEMHVFATVDKKANDFGYIEFKKEKYSFQVSVTAEGSALTGAEAIIMKGTETISTIQLSNEVNTIEFIGDKHETYQLVIIKDGYGKYSRDFSFADLEKELDGQPLQLTLQPALTFRFHTLATRFRYAFAIVFPTGTTGNLNVDWGDGTVQSYSFQNNEIGHVYQTEGDYFVSITGDVASIVEFFYYYNDEVTSVSAMNFERLTSLKFLAVSWARVPAVLDLTYNTKLEVVQFEDLLELEQLILPTDHYLRNIALTGQNNLTSDDINYIINDIYNNAVEKNINTGFRLFQLYDETGQFAGPPSAEAIEQLRQLRDVYGWNIQPNP